MSREITGSMWSQVEFVLKNIQIWSSIRTFTFCALYLIIFLSYNKKSIMWSWKEMPEDKILHYVDTHDNETTKHNWIRHRIALVLFWKCTLSTFTQQTLLVHLGPIVIPTSIVCLCIVRTHARGGTRVFVMAKGAFETGAYSQYHNIIYTIAEKKLLMGCITSLNIRYLPQMLAYRNAFDISQTLQKFGIESRKPGIRYLRCI